ncbi:hypothetical protein EYF80_027658 [Liparis tanakae]|uniref:Uncharacterized protein n=1 Tax=Liparis tanakae TaxID=230148 RepID=A0A4Z2H826_9TELE|nr:hypothetical protein EYF80_027658 [Liparis tanakae]
MHRNKTVTDCRKRLGPDAPMFTDQASAASSVAGSGVGVGLGVVASGAASDRGVGAGDTAGVYAEERFGGMAGMCVTMGAAGGGLQLAGGVTAPPMGAELTGGVSALPAVASVSCSSLITSRSFPHFLSALPVLPAPVSTSSWAKLSMLSRILRSSAPSSSPPTAATPSLFSPWGRGGGGGVRVLVMVVGPFMARWLDGVWSWNWAGGGGARFSPDAGPGPPSLFLVLAGSGGSAIRGFSKSISSLSMSSFLCETAEAEEEEDDEEEEEGQAGT